LELVGSIAVGLAWPYKLSFEPNGSPVFKSFDGWIEPMLQSIHRQGSIQRKIRPSIQREDQLTMKTKPEQLAAKARREPKLCFTSLAHHISAIGIAVDTVITVNRIFD
jgi:hypothetical protein